MNVALARPDPTDLAARDEPASEHEATPKRPAAPPTVPTGRGHGGSLTKVTVNLIPRAMVALEEVSAATGDTKTEAINRAIQLYAWVEKMIQAGESVRVVSPDGTVREIQMF